VVRLCSELISINTSNPTHPEAPAAEYVAEFLASIGIEATGYEPAPGRRSLIARVPGGGSDLPPLLVHAHLDTVPAVPGEWSVDPFAGVVQDGYVWGRGAVDMKSMIAAVLAVLKALHDSGRRPNRDLVLAFFADEEAGGNLGAGWLVANHPELFDGCREAIGEIGGFSYTPSGDQRLYLVSAAEKGVYWARFRATGKPGHGSMIHDFNSVSAVCGAVARVADNMFAAGSAASVERFLSEAARVLGRPGASPEQVLDELGPIGRLVRATTRDTANPTTVQAGYKTNVVPSTAEATIDVRFLPGHEDLVRKEIARLAGDDVSIETEFAGPAVEAPWDVPLLAAMQDALLPSDPSAVVVPYMTPAFTDAKWLHRLGIHCYGFCPLQLPPDLDFSSLFHGIDERVPVTALNFAADVLDRFLTSY
jgi:acetylornithine deacetylase/succinyl-diaminopimelate desuccinylase-like protein